MTEDAVKTGVRHVRVIDDQWDVLKGLSREQLFVSATVNSNAIQNFAAPTLIDLLILSVSDEKTLIE